MTKRSGGTKLTHGFGGKLFLLSKCYTAPSGKSISITPHADDQKEVVRESMRNWRSWGSWFSWGSPVGLGIWFVCVAAAVWIIMQAFH